MYPYQPTFRGTTPVFSVPHRSSVRDITPTPVKPAELPLFIGVAVVGREATGGACYKGEKPFPSGVTCEEEVRGGWAYLSICLTPLQAPYGKQGNQGARVAAMATINPFALLNDEGEEEEAPTAQSTPASSAEQKKQPVQAKKPEAAAGQAQPKKEAEKSGNNAQAKKPAGKEEGGKPEGKGQRGDGGGRNGQNKQDKGDGERRPRRDRDRGGRGRGGTGGRGGHARRNGNQSEEPARELTEEEKAAAAAAAAEEEEERKREEAKMTLTEYLKQKNESAAKEVLNVRKVEEIDMKGLKILDKDEDDELNMLAADSKAHKAKKSGRQGKVEVLTDLNFQIASGESDRKQQGGAHGRGERSTRGGRRGGGDRGGARGGGGRRTGPAVEINITDDSAFPKLG
eukprot:765810-Hanusia_phi.AAC.3